MGLVFFVVLSLIFLAPVLACFFFAKLVSKGLGLLFAADQLALKILLTGAVRVLVFAGSHLVLGVILYFASRSLHLPADADGWLQTLFEAAQWSALYFSKFIWLAFTLLSVIATLFSVGLKAVWQGMSQATKA